MWNSIPKDDQGNIAAMIIPIKKLIYINEDIPALNIPALKSGFSQSTIAHEIGHWMLHINQDAVGEYIDREEQGIEVKILPVSDHASSFLTIPCDTQFKHVISI